MTRINCSQYLLETLVSSRKLLSKEAQNHIKSFVLSQQHNKGGFTDRANKPDIYYSVFGYTLSLIMDISLNLEKERKYLSQYQPEEKNDLVHKICLVRCHFLLRLIEMKQKSGISATLFLSIRLGKYSFLRKLLKLVKFDIAGLLCEIEAYSAADGGYNHNQKGAEKSTVYANYLMWSLHQDLQTEQEVLDEILQANERLQLENGSFVNEEHSSDGITSSTAAGLIMSLESKGANAQLAAQWLKTMRTKRGGYKAAEDVPVADLLSTATALLALQLAGGNSLLLAEESIDFIHLHWDESGGFFGSIADMTCDVEYTYYALLALGVLSANS